MAAQEGITLNMSREEGRALRHALRVASNHFRNELRYTPPTAEADLRSLGSRLDELGRLRDLLEAAIADRQALCRVAASRELKWIDGADLGVGQRGFLVRIEPVQSAERYELRDRPALTNQARQPKVFGLAGTTNYVAVYGCGLWEVVTLARNGRAKVAQLVEREEIHAALEELGYPDLLDDALRDGA